MVQNFFHGIWKRENISFGECFKDEANELFLNQYLSHFLRQICQIKGLLNKSITAPIQNCLGLAIDTVSAGKQRFYRWIDAF